MAELRRGGDVMGYITLSEILEIARQLNIEVNVSFRPSEIVFDFYNKYTGMRCRRYFSRDFFDLTRVSMLSYLEDCAREIAG